MQPPHGSAFKKWAARAQSATGIPVTTTHSYTIFKKHKYSCVDCGAVFRRHSKSIDVSRKVCGRCRGKLTYAGSFQRNGTRTPVRKLSEYNEFVRKNYASVKSMKKLGEMWRRAMRLTTDNED